LGYEEFDIRSGEYWGLFDYRPAVFRDAGMATRLASERDLHGDMLREPGVRADAHIVRYQLAATLIRPGDTVLDAACGLGYGSHVLAKLSPAARITGIDVSEPAIDFAMRNYAGNRVAFRCGSLPEALLEIPDDSMDFIVSLETLEHVPEPGMLLTGFARVLKPGGRIFVSVPNDWADESGKDPSPYHLHVYDWSRIKQELDADFKIELAWGLTANGCKSAQDRVWRPQPRRLESAPLDTAATTECEWWLVLASKSPLAVTSRPCLPSVHAQFMGEFHLVNFAEHYDRPWLVPSMVEIPWRIRDRKLLESVAEEVIRESRPGSADQGAGLAVKGWRVLEDEGAESLAATRWLAMADSYLADARASKNPHVLRWCVSLDYLVARFLEARDDLDGASNGYQRVIKADVLSITPTLGTKLADASLRAGLLAFREGHEDQALLCWREGLDAVFQCLHSNPMEFIGNLESPYLFAMNDLVEMTDGASLLANAIRTVASEGRGDRALKARRLASLRQQALRSALLAVQTQTGRLSVQLAQCLAERTAKTKLAESYADELGEITLALSQAEQLAALRLDETIGLNHQLIETRTAQQSAEALALERQRALITLDAQLKETTAALEQAERLATGRLCEMSSLNQQLTDLQLAHERTEALALERQHALITLDAQLKETTAALEQAERLAAGRLCELSSLNQQRTDLQLALQHAESLVMERDQTLLCLNEEINRVKSARLFRWGKRMGLN
jgi:SAM-dependent methyltransferase